jgi:3',5'-cyclic AMP phosphodiesterase CpdA
LHRLLHVSDVHFGPKHLPAVAAGLERLAHALRPDLVVVSGDLTQRAKPRQFREARAWAERLGAPVLAVPGNHDVPLYRVWERALTPYAAYRRHFRRELEPAFEQPGLLVLGINTAFGWTLRDGRFLARRLAEVEARCRAVPRATWKVVVAHHHLVSPPGFEGYRLSWGAHSAAERLGAAGVDLLLSGHQHQSFVGSTEAFYPDAPPLLVAHTGTSTSSRGRGAEHGANTCFSIELDGTALVLTPWHWEAASGSWQALAPQRHRRCAGGEE